MVKRIALSVVIALIMSFGHASAISQTQKAQPVVNKEKTVVKSSKPLKKDGTPDMRYKENKAGAKPAKHLKKDGTPDKRFTENK